jgi:hypothetical protein
MLSPRLVTDSGIEIAGNETQALEARRPIVYSLDGNSNVKETRSFPALSSSSSTVLGRENALNPEAAEKAPTIIRCSREFDSKVSGTSKQKPAKLLSARLQTEAGTDPKVEKHRTISIESRFTTKHPMVVKTGFSGSTEMNSMTVLEKLRGWKTSRKRPKWKVVSEGQLRMARSPTDRSKEPISNAM